MRLDGLQVGDWRHLTTSEQAATVAEDICPLAMRFVDAGGTRIALGNASMGNIRSETLRAFTEDEYRKIIASLS